MYRKKSLSNFILLALEKSVDGLIRIEDILEKPYHYSFGAGFEYSLKQSELALAFKRLRERGLVDFVSDEKLAYRLTDEGRQKAVIQSLAVDDKKWDGKWRIVIWDIPEKRRNTRDLLRYQLKSWGFIPWQQSIWITKKDCAKPLREYIKKIGINDWVKVLVSDDIGD